VVELRRLARLVADGDDEAREALLRALLREGYGAPETEYRVRISRTHPRDLASSGWHSKHGIATSYVRDSAARIVTRLRARRSALYRHTVDLHKVLVVDLGPEEESPAARRTRFDRPCRP
jgi:hypothetical protein